MNETSQFGIRPGSQVSGPTLPERIEVLAVIPMGTSLNVIGRSLKTGLTYDPVLSALQVAQLTISADKESAAREHEMARIAGYVRISLDALIDRQQNQLGEYLNRQVEGQTVPGLDGLIAQAEQHLDDLNNRRETCNRELELERHCAIADITHRGRARILPHPNRTSPQLAPMVRDDEIERVAVQLAITHEEARGWVAECVESENRGFDLISWRPHPEDPKTCIEVRLIEVKGRAGVGVVALSSNEYQTAVRLKSDYRLCVAFNCTGTPQLQTIQNPAQLGWKAVMAVEHDQIGPEAVREAQS